MLLPVDEHRQLPHHPNTHPMLLWGCRMATPTSCNNMRTKYRDLHCIMSNGQTQGCQKAYKASQVMQIQALLLFSLLALSSAQPTPEPEPESTSSESSDGLVSYILTYSQTLSCEALQTKCKDLNCTAVICGIVKQLVVMQDPEGVSALSVDLALSQANQNVQVSLDYVTRDVITAANASLEISPPWHLDRINQATLSLDGMCSATYSGIGVHIYLIDTGIQTNHSEFPQSRRWWMELRRQQ